MANSDATGRLEPGTVAKATSGQHPSLSAYSSFIDSARTAAGRSVGSFERLPSGVVVLVKHGLDPARHQLRRPPAWALQRAHIERLEALGGPDAAVELYCVGGAVFRATVRDFLSHGIAVARGYGEQVALPLCRWTLQSPPTEKGADAPAAPRQLGLWPQEAAA